MRRNLPRFPKSRKPALLRLIPHLIFIAALLGAYYYIWQHNLFYNYLSIIFIGVKIIIAIDIFFASISTILAPIVTLLVAAGFIYFNQHFTFSIYAFEWQLLIMAVMGFFVRFLIR